MTELRDRFRLLDDVDVPDLSQRIEEYPARPRLERGPRRLLVAAIALLIGIAPLVLVARSFVQTDSRAPVQGGIDQTEFVFSAPVDGAYRIQIVDETGAAPRVLNDSVPQQVDPVWSPDGTHIAFSGGTNPNSEPDDIYVMNADGTNLRQITSGTEIDWNPAWSPDGTRIAFARLVNGHANIFVVDLETLEAVQLADNTFGQDQNPAWSPDGTKIAFGRNIDTIPSIYVMDADGSNVTRLSDPGRGSDAAPAWSPDGTRIAFARQVNQNRGTGDVYVMNADGTGVTQLTTDPADDTAPVWSPDGTRIAFMSNRDGAVSDADHNMASGVLPPHAVYDPRNTDIYVMDADGSNERRVTFAARAGYSPNGYGGADWRPVATTEAA
jgi:Tol biopolymer transport system component